MWQGSKGYPVTYLTRARLELGAQFMYDCDNANNEIHINQKLFYLIYVTSDLERR